MLRTLIRILGFFSLASGFLAGVVDGTRSIGSAVLEWSSLGNTIAWLSPKTFTLLEEAVPRLIHPLVWNPVLTGLFQLPAIMTLFALGLLLLWLARPKFASISPRS